MKAPLRPAFLLLAGAILGACATTESYPDGIQRADMDLSADPAEDFYQYANGAWLEANPIPAAYRSWSVGREVHERNQEILHKILLEDAADPGKVGEVRQQIGDFYASGMDVDRIAELGAAPLQPWLAKIDAIQSPDDLLTALPELQLDGLSALLGIMVEADPTDSNMTVAFVVQDGFGLPEKDYYLKTDEESVVLREKYTAHIATMFGLLGEDAATAAENAATVLRLETALAQKSFGAMDFRNPQNLSNKMSLADAQAMLPHMPLTEYLARLGIETSELNMLAPEYWPELDRLLTTESVADWKTYFRWHLVHGAADALSPEFELADFDFYSRTMNGVEEMKPRWKRVQAAVNGSIGQAVGQEYVKRAFSPEAKKRAEGMVEDLLWAMESRIKSLDWMSDETRAKALEKLAAFNYKIGYPDEWKTYAGLEIKRDDYFGNLVRAGRYETKREFAKIGKPVDKGEWGMDPQVVNAYYHPMLNEVVFPAGILQPPFFSEFADDAVNYGSMGAVIGHEITHGFDDSGAQFDADGNLKMWWTEADFAEFNRRADGLVKQFDAYQIEDGTHVNGSLTLGENIADLGGLHIAYMALMHRLGDEPQADIDGFSTAQRFFLAFARSWRGHSRLEALKVQINTDPHSPSYFRAIGPVGNLQQFADAFQLDASSPMMRPVNQRVDIW
jgi:putative endopeptidase